MTYLTYATDWLNSFGPIAWGVAFIIGGYAALGLLYLWEVLSSRRFINRQAEATFAKDGINPREKRFEKQAVPLQAFYSPNNFSHKKKEFIDCDVFGPCLVHLDGCTLVGVSFRHCQIVIARQDILIMGFTAFKECSFLGGTMANATMIMSLSQYNSFPEELRQAVPVIH